jgi:hypothetical protein
VYASCTTTNLETTMNLKTIATLAAALVASSAWAGAHADQKCGAGTCGKKETSSPKGDAKDAGCGKKDASCSNK